MATRTRRCPASPMFFLAVVVSVGAPGSLAAQFQDPIPLTGFPGEERTPGSLALGIDDFNNLFIGAIEGGDLTLLLRSGSKWSSKRLPGPATKADPALDFTALSTFLVYSEADPFFPEKGSQIFQLSMVGSLLGPVHRLSTGGGDNRRPRIGVDWNSNPIAAWSHQQAGGGYEIIVLRSGEAPQSLGAGDNVRLGVDLSGAVHILFIDAAGELLYAYAPGDLRPLRFGPPRHVASFSGLPETYHDLSICGGNRLLIAYRDAANLYLVKGEGGLLEEPELIASGDIHAPSLSCSSIGILGVTWERDGDIYYRYGGSFFLFPEARAFATPERESNPHIAVDTFLNVSLTFQRDGKLFFTTNAAMPHAGFKADPGEGEVPLRVSFTDLSSGDIHRWAWDFGDGSSSTEKNPTHLYDKPGLYSVKLIVEGPGGISTLAGERQIRVLDPFNVMTVSPRRVFPGERKVYVPISITHKDPIQGFQIAVRFDPTVLALADVDYNDTNLTQVQPELVVANTFPSGGRSVYSAGIVIDFVWPFDGRTLPPGIGQRLANLIFDVNPSALPGTETVVALENEVGDPPINNIFAINGLSVLPVLESAVIRIADITFPPPRYFLRGDVDGSLDLNITDAIFHLEHLFLGGNDPPCLDAADVNDDGRIDISDPIVLLGYLFLGGTFLPPPFPDFGLDPTDDEIPDCPL